MLGAVVVAVTLIAMLVTLSADPPQTFLLRTSSTFDVTNLRYLAGYADSILVANVQEIEKIKDEHTQYRVAVEETVQLETG